MAISKQNLIAEKNLPSAKQTFEMKLKNSEMYPVVRNKKREATARVRQHRMRSSTAKGVWAALTIYEPLSRKKMDVERVYANRDMIERAETAGLKIKKVTGKENIKNICFGAKLRLALKIKK